VDLRIETREGEAVLGLALLPDPTLQELVGIRRRKYVRLPGELRLEPSDGRLIGAQFLLELLQVRAREGGIEGCERLAFMHDIARLHQHLAHDARVER
jgi:hypothetical protein